MARQSTASDHREEMATLLTLIQHEKDVRKSLRISTSETYYASQSAYLKEQIASFQKKLDVLTERFENGVKLMEQSKLQQADLQKRYLRLKHRRKLEKLEELKAKLAETQAEIAKLS